MLKVKIGSVYQDLTSTEKMIADYLIRHYLDIPKMTSYQLATASQVGQSSIIRFTKKLGYNSFRELLADINPKDDQSYNYDEIIPNESIATTNTKVSSKYFEIINLTARYNLDETYHKAIRLLNNSKNVICFGAGHSNYFAEYLAAQLLIAGIACKSYTNTHLIFSEILILEKADTLIIFSETGESREVVFAAKEAQKRGVNVIAVTKQAETNLVKNSDIVFYTVNYDVRNMLKTTTIRCSQLFVIDTLLLNLFKTNYDYYREKSELGRQVITKVFPKLK